MIKSALEALGVEVPADPIYKDFRAGDVRHSQADISKARRLLGYDPVHKVADGLDAAMPWYRDFLRGG
ncbi:MAG: LPS biosynthesis protein WbpP, partial [Alphaproteobacteria bacterium]|nr:LPS biosynthesis protein WbpP [Alphaproteobacteria bacterium]